jgi:hypothetical protein
LSPWVGRGGCRHLLAEWSWEFMECVSGDLLVGLGGHNVVPSYFSGVRPIEGRVVSFM